jgi:Domain of unknown function (DUF1707)
MAEPEDQMAAAGPGHGHFKTSHADREQVIEVLKAAFVQDRLAKDEFDARVGHALASRTCAELAAITADIPAALPAAQPPRKPARARARLQMNTAVTGGACVAMASNIGMVLALLSGSWVIVVVVSAIIVVGITAAIGTMIVAS